jgi:hypothetical protein
MLYDIRPISTRPDRIPGAQSRKTVDRAAEHARRPSEQIFSAGPNLPTSVPVAIAVAAFAIATSRAKCPFTGL